MNGKSTVADAAESLGRWLEARVAIKTGKCVRERAWQKVINESGTAADTASCTNVV